MHAILEEEESFILPPDMAKEYLKAVNYIKNAEVAKLKVLLTFYQDLRNFICPDSGYNLIGVAILNNAPVSIINLLIDLHVSIDGIKDGSKIPLKAIPFVNLLPEQIDAAYELIKAGAKYDFCENETTLWLDSCQQFNKRLYTKIFQAIRDRAKYLGEFEEPSVECLYGLKHKRFFFDIKLAVSLRKAELQRQEEELLELRPKILNAKQLAEEALQEGLGCSIKMQIIDRTEGVTVVDRAVDLLINKTGTVNVEDNLKNLFNHSKKKFKAAKKTVDKTPDNIEANRVLALYHQNGWGGAELNTELAEDFSKKATKATSSKKRATI
ncbi:MAG: hypothetical protein ABSA84_00700 [Gammaproteobacteria bacterium]|jgi:hypothetical protein